MAIVTWWNEALEALSGEAYFLEARRKTAGQGLVACENLFNTYVRAVCGQQVNTAVAEKMAQSVFRYAGDKGDNAADALAGRLAEIDDLRAEMGATLDWLERFADAWSHAMTDPHLFSDEQVEALASVTETSRVWLAGWDALRGMLGA